MVDIPGMISKFKSMKAEQGPEEFTPEVEDRQLISLQKQRNIQLNEMEKKRLRKVVNDFNMGKTRKELFGITGPAKKSRLLSKTTRKNSFLRDDKPLLKEKTKNVKIKFI